MVEKGEKIEWVVGWHLALGTPPWCCFYCIKKHHERWEQISHDLHVNCQVSLQIHKSATQMNWPLSAFITRNDPRSLY